MGAGCAGWRFRIMLLKLECVSQSPPHGFCENAVWFSRSGLGPEIPHFHQVSRQCWCCWSEAYILNDSKALRDSCPIILHIFLWIAYKPQAQDSTLEHILLDAPSISGKLYLFPWLWFNTSRLAGGKGNSFLLQREWKFEQVKGFFTSQLGTPSGTQESLGYFLSPKVVGKG